MDNNARFSLPLEPESNRAEPDDFPSPELAEIDAAIALVDGGVARRVRLTGWPLIERVAATGLARAQAAGVAFAVERNGRGGGVTVTIGPLE